MAQRTVLCFGDSNTHGTRAMRYAADRRRLDKQERWTSVMAEALGTDWDVIVEGHPGRTSVYEDPIEGIHKSGLRILPSILESHRPLDLVIVALGTNDVKARFGQSAFEVALGIQRIAFEISSSDSGPDGATPQVLLAAPVTALETGIFTEIFAGAAAKSAELPARVATIASAGGFGFVDLNAVAKVDPTDGIHLDRNAHAAIGLHMAEAVSTLMN